MAKTVKFLKVYPPYNAGETAQFSDNIGERLVAEGVASATDFAPTPALGAQLLAAYKAGSSAAMADHRAAGFGRGRG